MGLTPTEQLFLGIGISILGSTISNLGQNAQKYAQVMNDALPPAERQASYTSLWRWWFGFFCVVVGSICDFAALSMAPQSVVMPVGAFTLVCNLFFAHTWLGEPVTARDIRATGYIIAGAALVAVAYGALGEVSNRNYSLDELLALYKRGAFATYAVFVGSVAFLFYRYIRQLATVLTVPCVFLVPLLLTRDSQLYLWRALSSRGGSVVAFLFFYSILTKAELALLKGADSPGYARYAKLHPVSYAALSGTYGSCTVLFAKSTVTLINVSLGGENQFAKGPFPFVIITCMLVAIALQTHYLAKGLQFFDALFIIPVFQCFFIIFSILGGAVYFEELQGFNGNQWAMFLSAVVITVYGVLLLSARDMGGSADAMHQIKEEGLKTPKGGGGGGRTLGGSSSSSSRMDHQDPAKVARDAAPLPGSPCEKYAADNPLATPRAARKINMGRPLPSSAAPAPDTPGTPETPEQLNPELKRQDSSGSGSLFQAWAPHLRGLGQKVEVVGKGVFLLPWHAARDFAAVARSLKASTPDRAAVADHMESGGWRFTPREFRVVQERITGKKGKPPPSPPGGEQECAPAAAAAAAAAAAGEQECAPAAAAAAAAAASDTAAGTAAAAGDAGGADAVPAAAPVGSAGGATWSEMRTAEREQLKAPRVRRVSMGDINVGFGLGLVGSKRATALRLATNSGVAAVTTTEVAISTKNNRTTKIVL